MSNNIFQEIGTIIHEHVMTNDILAGAIDAGGGHVIDPVLLVEASLNLPNAVEVADDILPVEIAVEQLYPKERRALAFANGVNVGYQLAYREINEDFVKLDKLWSKYVGELLGVSSASPLPRVHTGTVYNQADVDTMRAYLNDLSAMIERDKSVPHFRANDYVAIIQRTLDILA